MRHERAGKGRPPGLVRGAKTLPGLAVEVLIEEQRIPPRRVVLEAGVRAVRGAAAVRVEQKQTQETTLELVGDLVQIRFFARSGRQLDSQVVLEEVVEVSQRLDGEEVEWKPDRPAPVGVAAKKAAA